MLLSLIKGCFHDRLSRFPHASYTYSTTTYPACQGLFLKFPEKPAPTPKTSPSFRQRRSASLSGQAHRRQWFVFALLCCVLLLSRPENSLCRSDGPGPIFSEDRRPQSCALSLGRIRCPLCPFQVPFVLFNGDFFEIPGFSGQNGWHRGQNRL